MAADRRKKSSPPATRERARLDERRTFADFHSVGREARALVGAVAEKAAPRKLVEGFVSSASSLPTDTGWRTTVKEPRMGDVVERFPGPGPKVAIAAGGRAPRWSPDGRAVYFRRAKLLPRTGHSGRKARAGRSRGAIPAGEPAGFSVAPDGKASSASCNTPTPESCGNCTW